MGKGDKKTKRGKIVIGSYGVRRKREKSTAYVAPVQEEKIVKKITEKKETPVVAAVKEKPEPKKKTTAAKEKPVKETKKPAAKSVAQKTKKEETPE